MSDMWGSGLRRDWDGHALLLSRTEEERQEAVANRARRGFELGERVIYSQLENDAQERSVVGLLAQDGWDVPALQATGQLQVLPVTDYFPRERQLGHVERALDDGYPAVRVSTEAVALLKFLSTSEYDSLEVALEEMCEIHPLSALCQYDLNVPVTALRNGHQTHHKFRESGFDADVRHDGIALAGEIDLQNSDALAAAVHQATGLADDLFWVDLQALTFLDISACRALLNATSDFRWYGGDVVLHGASPSIRRLLEVVAVDREARISVVERRP